MNVKGGLSLVSEDSIVKPTSYSLNRRAGKRVKGIQQKKLKWFKVQYTHLQKYYNETCTFNVG
jgi:hypothetical protein